MENHVVWIRISFLIFYFATICGLTNILKLQTARHQAASFYTFIIWSKKCLTITCETKFSSFALIYIQPVDITHFSTTNYKNYLNIYAHYDDIINLHVPT